MARKLNSKPPTMTADVFTRQERSRIMAGIRSKDTKPEILVRSALHRSGFRFRLHRRNLPGCPDIVLKKYSALVFVHGCFWHQHSGCKRVAIPKSNQDYWQPKLLGNVKRFKENRIILERMGWRVFVFWECEARNANNFVRLMREIKQSSYSGASR